MCFFLSDTNIRCFSIAVLLLSVEPYCLYTQMKTRSSYTIDLLCRLRLDSKITDVPWVPSVESRTQYGTIFGSTWWGMEPDLEVS